MRNSKSAVWMLLVVFAAGMVLTTACAKTEEPVVTEEAVEEVIEEVAVDEAVDEAVEGAEEVIEEAAEEAAEEATEEVGDH